MKGYLYVEEDLHGLPNGSYTKRYFAAFPLLG
eukprot:CAMPEP_0173290724 /NCGR_PEP_ID=MMETSP1143-20121109/11729_1 /TAXON_ID=483371 /ORGANISM="non described non described, Strain CCMP2298" /LENGTH=31 /DNA_ID= /DNA_START= /DNA_END= /DNA_ORIENTATION=